MNIFAAINGPNIINETAIYYMYMEILTQHEMAPNMFL